MTPNTPPTLAKMYADYIEAREYLLAVAENDIATDNLDGLDRVRCEIAQLDANWAEVLETVQAVEAEHAAMVENVMRCKMEDNPATYGDVGYSSAFV